MFAAGFNKFCILLKYYKVLFGSCHNLRQLCKVMYSGGLELNDFSKITWSLQY